MSRKFIIREAAPDPDPPIEVYLRDDVDSVDVMLRRRGTDEDVILFTIWDNGTVSLFSDHDYPKYGIEIDSNGFPARPK